VWVIAPLNWPWWSYGQDVVEVAKRFTKQFNETHDDITIRLQVENWSCNGKDAVSAAQKLISIDRVVAIIWWVCSSETLAAGVVAQEQWVMMLAPGSASSRISDIWEYVVRTYNNTRAWQVLTNNLPSSYERVLVITEEKDYPKDMADRFVDAFDGEVAYYSYQSADIDMKTFAKQVVQEENIDALFMFSQSEATSIPLALALEDEWLLTKFAGHTYGANNLLVAPFLERLWSLAEWMQEVNVATTTIDYTQDPYMQTLDGYAIQWDWFTVLQAADAFRMIAWVVAEEKWSTTRDSIKSYIYSYNNANPYNWYLWTYWFDAVGDVVWIDFQMYEIVNWERIVQS